MKKIIIIRGNSGSGKTSVSKALQHKIGRNTLLISQDIIRRKMLWVKDGVNTQASSLLEHLIKYGYENCDVTIIEGILNSRWYTSLFEHIIELFKEENVYAYYYDISFEETLRRHNTRDCKCEFGEEEMKRWWNEKDYIGIIKEKVLLEHLSLDEVVEQILSDINLTML